MNYMIYIYAALAFIIAGGSGFICFHAGHRIGKREADALEYQRGYLTADAVNVSRTMPPYIQRNFYDYKSMREGELHIEIQPRGAGRAAHEDKARSRLSDAIDRHLERMDSDD